MIRTCWFACGLLALTSFAGAQVTTTGPFTGQDSDGFETQLPAVFTQCIGNRVFNNKADLCTPGNNGAHITTGWSFFCTIFPPGGQGSGHLYGSGGGKSEYTFDTPAQRFGGQFSTNYQTANGTAKLYDAGNALLGTFVINAPLCTWAWNGWDAGSGPKIKRVEISGMEPSGGFLDMDDMQVDFPGGVGTAFCFGDGTLATGCPCSNQGALGRGCDNSAATGGALLSASGSTSPDTVVMTASGALSSATVIFLQGDVYIANGLLFGDGLRCIGGALKRIGIRTAQGGSAVYPGPLDPSISARSAALGDPLAPGSQRMYQVYYLDSNLGFCPTPSGNSWDATNGIGIVW